HHVGPVLAGQGHGQAPVLRLTDHRHVRRGLHQHPEPGAQQRLIVGQQDPDHRAVAALATGSRAVASNPPPSCGPAARSPPTAAARSIIPVTPWPAPPLALPPRPSSATWMINSSDL